MIQAAAQAVRAKLTAATETPVYHTTVPAGIALPYILVSVAGGGSTNRTPADELDLTLTVKALSDAATDAADLANTVRDVLHEVALGTVGGWAFYRCQHIGAVFFTEYVGGEVVYHAGGSYRVRAVAAAPVQ